MLSLNCTDELDMTRLERGKNASPTSNTGNNTELESKKGIGMAYKEATWSTRIGRLKPFWHYSWNRDFREEIPDSVEFVPMFWGSGSVNDVEVDKIKQLVNAGVVKNVLGFNEPDLESQSNLTVDETVALWPSLKRLVSLLGVPLLQGFRMVG